MRRTALVLAAASLAVLTPTPAGAAPYCCTPFASIVGPVHTEWLRIKLWCPAGSTATVLGGLVSQPSDPDFGDPLGTPAARNVARFADARTVDCRGRTQSLRIALEPVPCDFDGCVPRPGLEKGVRADVRWFMTYGDSTDDEDVVRLDVRVV